MDSWRIMAGISARLKKPGGRFPVTGKLEMACPLEAERLKRKRGHMRFPRIGELERTCSLDA
jgi:hypothetical protein